MRRRTLKVRCEGCKAITVHHNEGVDSLDLRCATCSEPYDWTPYNEESSRRLERELHEWSKLDRPPEGE